MILITKKENQAFILAHIFQKFLINHINQQKINKTVVTSASSDLI